MSEHGGGNEAVQPECCCQKYGLEGAKGVYYHGDEGVWRDGVVLLHEPALRCAQARHTVRGRRYPGQKMSPWINIQVLVYMHEWSRICW